MSLDYSRLIVLVAIVGLILSPIILMQVILPLIGSETSRTPEEKKVGTIDVDLQQMNGTEPVYLSGIFTFELNPNGKFQRTYDNVTLCAFHRNGSVLSSQNLGTFETPYDGRNFSLRTRILPTYVLVYHPAFIEIHESHSFKYRLLYRSQNTDKFTHTSLDAVQWDHLDFETCHSVNSVPVRSATKRSRSPNSPGSSSLSVPGRLDSPSRLAAPGSGV